LQQQWKIGQFLNNGGILLRPLKGLLVNNTHKCIGVLGFFATFIFPASTLMSLFPLWEVSHLQVKFLWTATGTTESNCITFSTFPDQLFDSPRVLALLCSAWPGRDPNFLLGRAQKHGSRALERRRMDGRILMLCVRAFSNFIFFLRGAPPVVNISFNYFRPASVRARTPSASTLSVHIHTQQFKSAARGPYAYYSPSHLKKAAK
jgi:hypothetical protein